MTTTTTPSDVLLSKDSSRFSTWPSRTSLGKQTKTNKQTQWVFYHLAVPQAVDKLSVNGGNASLQKALILFHSICEVYFITYIESQHAVFVAIVTLVTWFISFDPFLPKINNLVYLFLQKPFGFKWTYRRKARIVEAA